MMRSDLLRLKFRESASVEVEASPLEWRGFRLEHVALDTDQAYDFASEGQQHYLAFHDMVLAEGELQITGLPNQNRSDLRGTLTFAPRGCSIAGWARPVARRNSYTALYFDLDELREDLQDIYAENDPAPFAYAADPGLQATMGKLAAMTASSRLDRLHAEALGLAAVLEVLKVPRLPIAGRLSARQLQIVRDFVEANLARPIGLDDLAATVGLSRSHFSRAFKASTGLGPHGFVTRRRIERAREMLKPATVPIDAIAMAVGFESGAVFRRAFKRVLGMSPQTYRTEIG